MSTRIVVQLAAFRSQEDPAWREVVETLDSVGATHITPPRPELPNVATAQLPTQVDTDAALARIRAAPSVARAEIDAWSTSF